jgi:thiol-disulfide isomerase/thioredoxin
MPPAGNPDQMITNLKISCKTLGMLLIYSLFLAHVSACSSQRAATAKPKNETDQLNYNVNLLSENNTTIPLSNFKNKVLFINIWATWCPPCRKEMPSIQNLSQRISSPDVEFLLISSEDLDKIVSFKKETDLRLPVYSLPGNLPPMLRGEYIPRTYIIDRFGKIVHQHVGEKDWNTEDIYGFINFLANVRLTE